ncbi:MAG TPA: glycosyltransferase [Gaiellaceae bacterium]|jgi:glycosyltransferase involved in cell wall biosynthesis|nr:glycosyltransferase [Gaiellaceae bacterium]
MSGPLVSVIVPTWNAASYLADALECIAAQSYAPHETLIVDAGSTDGTLEIAARFGLTPLRQTGTGLADAWNCGLAAASGEAIAFLDSDDTWAPDKLEKQAAVLEARPEVDAVITRVRFVLEPGLEVPPGFRAELLDGDYLSQMPSSLLARRSVFERIGEFDTRWEIASDIDWFARVLDSDLRVEVVDEVLVSKRIHDSNLSNSGGPRLGRELIEVLRLKVARGRGDA